MIGVIGRRVRSLEMGIDRELAAFVAYFDFLRENPEFYRLFTEASVYSPVAYDAHIRLIMDNFAKSLRMQKVAGRIRLPEEDIVPLAYSLVGVRTYMTQLLMRDGRGFSKLPDQFVSVYAAILSGIFIHE
jgi:hypothetical protein